MEALKDIFAGWNCAARVPDGQNNLAAIATRADADPPAGAIVLSCVLQEILHDERRVPFFAGYKQSAWKFLLDVYIRRIRKRAKIVEPLIDELAKIYWCQCDFQMTSVHARQKKQLVYYAGQTMRLMEQSGQLLVNPLFKIFARQQ